MPTLDANEAVADVAYRLNEVIAIYPITPASSMGEYADAWSAEKRPNIWGAVPEVIEMQSEGGAAGAVHGALQAGALATTFTSSQGLLLMLPNMYKIAGELTPFVLHVAARSLATHALSIFGDHSDVYAARATGFALLCSSTVQEAHDLALVSQAASLRARVPFLHFFDGFRTSHEINKIERLSDQDLQASIDDALVAAHRERALSPDRPKIRGTAQNPDTFFQAREAISPFYRALPAILKAELERFAARTGRRYGLVEYSGHPEAERVVIVMGSAAEAVAETVDWLVARGERVGVLKIRLLRPLPADAILAALPSTTQRIAVLDRSKEPGATGEPLYQEIVAALFSAQQEGRLRTALMPKVIGGRFGLSSKELNPAMVRGVFAELAKDQPKNGFTIGINDDVSASSLAYEESFDLEPDDVVRCIFYGLGADGTVGANKSSIKIIGEETDHSVQAYFVYDSKKSGAVTISHLRFGQRPIRSSYLIQHASFVAVHQWSFLDRLDVLEHAAQGAVLLINSIYGPEQVFDALPRELQQEIIAKEIKLYVIDASAVARASGMGGRINTVMQTCFFAISGVLPREQAIAKIKESIEKNYKKRGEEVVRMNFAAVDTTLAQLHRVQVPAAPTTTRHMPAPVSAQAPDFVQRVTALMTAGHGDRLPVSAFTPDGTWPTGTAQWEKRNIAQAIPVWDEELCIQCNKCALVCPHAAIRAKIYPKDALADRPEGFKSVEYKSKDFPSWGYTIQVAPEDCTGCTLCVQVCPARDKHAPDHKALLMAPQAPLLAQEKKSFEHFLKLPELDRTLVDLNIKTSQLLQPLFEYSGACAGCGETPYIKLLTQLYGDRLLIANATGCSSIFGGNLPTTPYTTDAHGRGPAWANSLFEDNAEFGLGIRLAVDHQAQQARALVRELAPELGPELVDALCGPDPGDESGLAERRAALERLRARLRELEPNAVRRLEQLAEYLVPRSVWIVGGDGWAYDIGYGGLDHVLASGKKVNVLVLDTEVYSNTGGQQSKSTPLGALARFAADGKARPKKDLGLLAMVYGDVYVGHVALGAKDQQTLKTFMEAEAHPGPALIIAYSPCIAHGYDLADALGHQRAAVETGYWPLYRFDPSRPEHGQPALQLDSAAPKGELADFVYGEGRFRALLDSDPVRAKKLLDRADAENKRRFALYEQMAKKV